MRHQRQGKHLSRNSKERKSLIRGLITSLVLDKKIVTTKTKAEVLKRVVEKVITFSKRYPNLTKQRLFEAIPNKKVVDEMVDTILPLIKDEKSGLTRITKLGRRKGDRAELVCIEWKILPKEEKKPKEIKKELKTEEKKIKKINKNEK